jgi:RNA polymerase sigma-70 factor (ECF subfamily)
MLPSMKTTITDTELVEALRRRESWAFESLVERHERLMLRVASSYVRSPAVAQEIVQDTWLSVFRGIDSFECRSTLKTWIFRILVNRAKTRGVSESRTVPFSSLQTDDSDGVIDRTQIPAPERELPDQRLIWRETFEHAVDAMGRLPESQRQVIAMRDIQGSSSKEVCSTLGITGGNQRVQLHRARATVRRELQRYLTPASLPASPGI